MEETIYNLYIENNNKLDLFNICYDDNDVEKNKYNIKIILSVLNTKDLNKDLIDFFNYFLILYLDNEDCQLIKDFNIFLQNTNGNSIRVFVFNSLTLLKDNKVYYDKFYLKLLTEKPYLECLSSLDDNMEIKSIKFSLFKYLKNEDFGFIDKIITDDITLKERLKISILTHITSLNIINIGFDGFINHNIKLLNFLFELDKTIVKYEEYNKFDDYNDIVYKITYLKNKIIKDFILYLFPNTCLTDYYIIPLKNNKHLDIFIKNITEYMLEEDTLYKSFLNLGYSKTFLILKFTLLRLELGYLVDTVFLERVLNNFTNENVSLTYSYVMLYIKIINNLLKNILSKEYFNIYLRFLIYLINNISSLDVYNNEEIPIQFSDLYIKLIFKEKDNFVKIISNLIFIKTILNYNIENDIYDKFLLICLNIISFLIDKERLILKENPYIIEKLLQLIIELKSINYNFENNIYVYRGFINIYINKIFFNFIKDSSLEISTSIDSEIIFNILKLIRIISKDKINDIISCLCDNEVYKNIKYKNTIQMYLNFIGINLENIINQEVSEEFKDKITNDEIIEPFYFPDCKIPFEISTLNNYKVKDKYKNPFTNILFDIKDLEDYNNTEEISIIKKEFICKKMLYKKID